MDGQSEARHTLICRHSFAEHALGTGREPEGSEGAGVPRRRQARARWADFALPDDSLQLRLRYALNARQKLPRIGVWIEGRWIHEDSSPLRNEGAEQGRVDEVPKPVSAIESVLFRKDLGLDRSDLAEDVTHDRSSLGGRHAGKGQEDPRVPALAFRPFQVRFDLHFSGTIQEREGRRGIIGIEVRYNRPRLIPNQQVDPVRRSPLEVIEKDPIGHRSLHLADVTGRRLVRAVDVRKAAEARAKEVQLLLDGARRLHRRTPNFRKSWLPRRRRNSQGGRQRRDFFSTLWRKKGGPLLKSVHRRRRQIDEDSL